MINVTPDQKRNTPHEIGPGRRSWGVGPHQWCGGLIVGCLAGILYKKRATGRVARRQLVSRIEKILEIFDFSVGAIGARRGAVRIMDRAAER